MCESGSLGWIVKLLVLLLKADQGISDELCSRSFPVLIHTWRYKLVKTLPKEQYILIKHKRLHVPPPIQAKQIVAWANRAQKGDTGTVLYLNTVVIPVVCSRGTALPWQDPAVGENLCMAPPNSYSWVQGGSSSSSGDPCWLPGSKIHLCVPGVISSGRVALLSPFSHSPSRGAGCFCPCAGIAVLLGNHGLSAA